VHTQAERVRLSEAVGRISHDGHQRQVLFKVDSPDAAAPSMFSLISAWVATAWEHLVQHVVHNTDMDEDEFALVLESGTLDDEAQAADAYQAIMLGAHLARDDGILHVGAGWSGCECWDDTSEWLGRFEVRRCTSCRIHATGITKRWAAALVESLQENIEASVRAGDSVRGDIYIIGSLLEEHTDNRNGTWTVNAGPWSPRSDA
jgi:hypothetical protein